MTKKSVGCFLCQAPVRKADRFMVKNKTWLETGLPERVDGFFLDLHLACLVKMLGRELQPGELVYTAAELQQRSDWLDAGDFAQLNATAKSLEATCS